MKKAIGMFAALIIALAMTGVAYACWRQTIYVTGTVKTGKLCVGWVDAWTDDNSGNDPGYEKNVGSSVVELKDKKGTHGEDIVYEKLKITVNNVYPCYSTTVTAVVANGGTIPVVVNGCPTVNIISDPKGLAPFLDVTCSIVDYPKTFWPDMQIDPCQTVTVQCTLHVLQDVDEIECPQNARLEFEVAIEFVQWNCAGE